MAKLITHSTITSVTEHFRDKWAGGVGPEAKFTHHSLGWYIFIDGAHEALYAGETEPEFKPGDKVKITVERID